MKHKTFISLIALLLLASISFIGCNDDGGGGSSQALTENDFADNPSLRAVPDKQIIVDFLESPGSDTPQFDTGPVGIDDIPLTYPQTETDTFCWTDDNSEAMDYMVLLDSQGEEVLRVDVNGDCVTEVIEPGDYVMEFHHDDSMDPKTIFMGPNLELNQQAMKTDGLFNGLKVEVAKILRSIKAATAKEARAQPEPSPHRTQKYDIGSICLSCNLSSADFRNADLSRRNLKFSTFRDANLRHANLRFASLLDVNFTGANLRDTRFDSADLEGAKLTGANVGSLFDCANFSNALWCNGSCRCDSGLLLSLCECTGCGSIRNACSVNNSCDREPPIPFTANCLAH